MDGSELAECVLPHVKAVALGCSVVKVTLIRGVAPLHMRGGLESHISPEERERVENLAIENAKEYLEKTAEQLKADGVAAGIEVAHGDVVHSIIDYAENTEVDLIIISTHGRTGVSRWVWGSVTDKILRAASVPVMMIRSPGISHGV